MPSCTAHTENVRQHKRRTCGTRRKRIVRDHSTPHISLARVEEPGTMLTPKRGNRPPQRKTNV